MVKIQNLENQFLELAFQEKMLSEQAVDYCKEKMLIGIPSYTTVLTEGFMDTQQVVKIYSLIYQNSTDHTEIYTAVPVLQEDDESSDEQFLKYVRENKLVAEEKLQLCFKEQKRLARSGHQIQMSALLYSMGNLDIETVRSCYQKILGQNTDIHVAEASELASLAGLPQLRKDVRRKASKDINFVEQMQEVVDQLEKKRVKKQMTKKRKLATKQPSKLQLEEIIDIPPEELQGYHDKTIKLDKPEVYSQETICLPQQQDQFLANSDEIALQPALNEILAILKRMEGIAEKPIPDEEISFEQDHELEEDAPQDSAEIAALKRGKTVVSEGKVIKMLRKGIALENCYLPNLDLSSVIIRNKLSLKNCVLQNLNMSQTEFHEDVDFEGSSFIGKAIFKGSIFQKEAQFKKTLFLDGGDFTKTEFHGNTRFHTAQFRRFVSFNRSDFTKKAIFSRCYFAKGAKFNEVNFNGAASFNDIYCDHRFYMDKCKFGQESTFSNAQFSDIADFSRTSFQKIKFKGTTFRKWATFQSAKFQDECHFNGTTISGDLSFVRAKFDGIINFRAICAERNVNFKNAKIGDQATFRFLDAYLGRLFISRYQLENHLESHLESDYKTARQEYGLLKNNFREINEYEKEDWAYLWEKRMERLSLKIDGIRPALSRFINWLALDMACGYGTKPLNIFATSLAVLLLFAGFYYSFGGAFAPDQGVKCNIALPAMEAIQVSFQTFTNASIEGWKAEVGSWLNYIMMLESFLGFFIMTVLVVTFSRKVIR